MEKQAVTAATMTVCVTGGSGYIGSWLVMRLLQRGYHVRATVRDPGNERKVKHLLELPNAKTHLSLWRADLSEDGSFDDAIQGCQGVFHVATPMEFDSAVDPENEVIKPTVNGVLSILRSCSKSNSVKRFVYTSTLGTIMVQPQPPLDGYNENCWSDIDFCYDKKMFGWMYVVAKTKAEKAAWKYAEENGLDLVSIHPPLVFGHFITPYTSFSIDVATSLFTRNQTRMGALHTPYAVHVDDVCSAHIYLFEHPLAKGRYICSSHISNIYEIANSLGLKYPEKNIPTEFEATDKSVVIIPCSSKKLMDLGFEFAHIDKDTAELCAETYESCREKGLL